MDYTALLRTLATGDPQVAARFAAAAGMGTACLGPKVVALVRLAAVASIGGSVASYSALVNEAIGAGASADEIAEVLVAIIPTVGAPRVVEAAPRLSLALGFDIDEPD